MSAPPAPPISQKDIPIGKRKYCLQYSHYVEDFFGIYDSRILEHDTQYKATLFEVIDDEQAFVHVEYPDSTNKLKFPRIWRIAAWRNSMVKWERDKERAEKQRIAWCKYTENRELLLAALHEMNGLTDKENFADADQIAQSKNVKRAEFLGVKLDL